MRALAVLFLVGAACGTRATATGADAAAPLPAADATAAEQPPAPAPGDGVADPPSSSLHDHGCAGVDWQLIGGWLLVAHDAPELAPADELDRCVARYDGWATNDADQAQVSRAMMYAALAATGQCAADHDWDGALMTGARCAAVNPGIAADDCAAQMASSRAFGIATLARVLAAAGHDVPLVAARLATGSATCGDTDRWKLVAPDGFVDHFVAAYNAYVARGTAPPSCAKHVVVTVALYSGMGEPGVDGVAQANGCWTYERVSKSSSEWKICQYNGTVYHADGVKWAYDDTNTYNNLATERSRVAACASGVSKKGYIYMANRGSGWREVTSTGVRSHFAELYSSQDAIDDQFSTWKSAGEPGAPMINVGEPSTSAAQITAATRRACAEVPDDDWFGVYIYPQSLEGDRMSALVTALDKCTAL